MARELIVGDEFILWGAWVVVPLQDRQAMLNELHETRPGCSKMKALAGCYIWWLKMNSVILKMVNSVRVVWNQDFHLQQLCFTPGSGLANSAPDCTWTLWVNFLRGLLP